MSHAVTPAGVQPAAAAERRVTPAGPPPAAERRVAQAASPPATERRVTQAGPPPAVERRVAPPSPPPAARVEAKPPSAAKPEADVPVLTVEFESSPEIAKEDEFSFDLALSAGQIDAVLGKDDVPTLTESVDSSAETSPTSDSMIMQFDEETQHKLANLEALANAKALEDISNSMAETLFGDAELDKLAATLALATGKHEEPPQGDEPARPAKARNAP
jgi:hypothetical protein